MKKLYLLLSGSLAASAMAQDDADYVSIGTGLYQDNLVEFVYGVATEAWAVDIQQSVSDANLYRVENPYAAEACPLEWGTFGAAFDATQADEYWYVNCTDPDGVIWTTFYSGIIDDNSGYNLGVFFDSRYVAYNCSTFADGVIKAVPYALYTWSSDTAWGYISATFYLPGVEAETWDYMCTARYTDGFWCLYTESEPQSWLVNVYESSLTSGLYRVENPYMADTCPIDFGDAYVGASGDLYWELDATDPDDVEQTALYFSTGVVINVSAGTEYPVFFYQAKKATMADRIITWNAGALYGYYIYNTTGYSELNETILQLDVTEGIQALEHNDNAVPVYYNLQGIEMPSATARGLYIVKQGSTTKKIMVK